MSSSILKAREIVLDRVPPEIFLAKQSASVWQNIGERCLELNGTEYQTAFATIQRQALSSLVLSLVQLFERPSDRYPNYSIPTAIAHLTTDIDSVRVNPASVVKLVDDLTDERDDQLYLLQNPDELPKILLNDFEDGCPKFLARSGSELDRFLEQIRVIRDKRVAHLEDVDISNHPRATWESVTQLLAFAESFVNLVGYGFFGASRKKRVKGEDVKLRDEPAGREVRGIIKALSSNKGFNRSPGRSAPAKPGESDGGTS